MRGIFVASTAIKRWIMRQFTTIRRNQSSTYKTGLMRSLKVRHNTAMNFITAISGTLRRVAACA